MNQEELKEIEELASLPGLTVADIAKITGREMSVFEATSLSDERRAYEKGKLLAKAELAKRLKQLSMAGSTPAQAHMIKLEREAIINELKEFYG